MASLPNPAVVPVMTYYYLFCLPSSERPQPPARRHAQGLLSRSCTQVPCVTSYDPNESGYDPVPSSNKWLVNQVLFTRYGPTTPG
jgi:hypothetical protein